MSEIINHVSDEQEAQQWQVAQEHAQSLNFTTGRHMENFDFAQTKLNELTAHTSSPEQAATVQEIITQGRDGDHKFPDALVAKDGHGEMEFRLKMAELFVRTPQTYEALRNHNIAGFHGTRSITLAGMLEVGGLVSTRRANKMADTPLLVAGEHLYQGKDGQRSISFSQVGYVDQAANYAAVRKDTVRTTEQAVAKFTEEADGYGKYMEEGKFVDVASAGRARALAAIKELQEHPDSLRSTFLRHDFPVMVGINADFLVDDQQKSDGSRNLQSGQGSLGEFRPFSDEIPLEALPVIAVPADKINGVKALFAMHGHPDLTVVPIEGLVSEHPKLAA